MLINQFATIPSFVSTALSVGIAIALYDPTRRSLVYLTDRFLFQKKEDALVILRRLSEEIIRVLDLNDLGRRIIDDLAATLRPENASLLVKSNTADIYEVIGHCGAGSSPRNIAASHPGLRYFQTPPYIINLEDPSKKTTAPHAAAELLQVFRAVVGIPLIVQGQLLGLLLLGKKKSDQEYDSREMEAFRTLSGQLAVAISNANLLSQIVLEREAKIHAEQKAELVNYTRTIKHEVGNSLVAVETAAMNMRNILSERFARVKRHLEPLLAPAPLRMFDDLLAQILKYSDTIQNAGVKIRIIIDTATGALHGDENAKQEIYFKIPWETAKRNAGITHGYRFITQVEDKFVIYGNIILLERLFENLFTNSRDALANEEEKLIYLNADYREREDKKTAWFEYWDGGAGIPESLFEKVFEQGFSTKPKPASHASMESGHGHGLYVCRKIVEEFHGGKIRLEKTSDGHSKFIFWLPLKEEHAIRKEEISHGGG